MTPIPRVSMPPPNSLAAWTLATRPKTLPAAAGPVLVGTALALHEGSVAMLPGAACLLGALLLQIASNFANDVFDYEKGADTEVRLGPTRAVQAGLIRPTSMKQALILSMGLALLVGVYLAWVAGWPIVAIGTASLIAAVAYTGGPYPLGYHGLGDVFVMLFFGFVAVCGTTFVHLASVPHGALLASVGVGAVTTNILVINNIRDRHTDRDAGKRTLAVRLGRLGAEMEFVLLYLISSLVPLGLWGLDYTGPHVCIALASAPLAIHVIRCLRRSEGVALNKVLAQTAQFVFVYSLLLSAGVTWSAVS